CGSEVPDERGVGRREPTNAEAGRK
ncbi:hypothetical protein EVA_12557, partial [gut metagenome]